MARAKDSAWERGGGGSAGRRRTRAEAEVPDCCRDVEHSAVQAALHAALDRVQESLGVLTDLGGVDPAGGAVGGALCDEIDGVVEESARAWDVS